MAGGGLAAVGGVLLRGFLLCGAPHIGVVTRCSLVKILLASVGASQTLVLYYERVTCQGRPMPLSRIPANCE